MGERLVIDIKRNNKSIATAYYHWSAYTVPSIHILHEMYTRVLCRSNEMSDEQLQLALIRFAEKTTGIGYAETEEDRIAMTKEFNERMTGAPDGLKETLKNIVLSHGGVDMPDLKNAMDKFPGESFNVDGISRNDGLIAITDASMQNCKDAAQGIIEVDLSNGKVCNGIIYDYDIAGYLEETEDDECAAHPDDLPRSPINIAQFPLEEVEIVKDVIDLTDCGWIKYDDRIYQFIEG